MKVRRSQMLCGHSRRFYVRGCTPLRKPGARVMLRGPNGNGGGAAGCRLSTRGRAPQAPAPTRCGRRVSRWRWRWSVGLGGCGGLVPQSRPVWSRRSARSAACRRRSPTPVDVKLTGTVTFFNSALDQAWVQDATGGVRVDRIGLDPLVHVGDVVELTGRATMGGPAPIVLRERLRIVSSGTPPPPIKVTAADVAEGRHQYLFVETSGIVRSASMDSRGRLALTLRTDGQDLTVSVREVGRADPAQYLDAGVTMHGVLVDQPRRPRPHRRRRGCWCRRRARSRSPRPAPTAPDIPPADGAGAGERRIVAARRIASGCAAR